MQTENVENHQSDLETNLEASKQAVKYFKALVSAQEEVLRMLKLEQEYAEKQLESFTQKQFDYENA